MTCRFQFSFNFCHFDLGMAKDSLKIGCENEKFFPEPLGMDLSRRKELKDIVTFFWMRHRIPTIREAQNSGRQCPEGYDIVFHISNFTALSVGILDDLLLCAPYPDPSLWPCEI